MPRREQMVLHPARAPALATIDVWGRLYNVTEAGFLEDQGFKETMSESDTRKTATIDIRGNVEVRVGDYIVTHPGVAAMHWIITEVTPSDSPFNETKTCQVQFYSPDDGNILYGERD